MTGPGVIYMLIIKVYSMAETNGISIPCVRAVFCKKKKLFGFYFSIVNKWHDDSQYFFLFGATVRRSMFTSSNLSYF